MGSLKLVSAWAVVCSLCGLAQAQSQPPVGPNSDPGYQQLRNVSLGSEAVTVNNFDLKRDAATFRLSGTVCFVAPVQGHVTGAVFEGNGTMSLEPPLPSERASLKLLSKEDEFVERFEQLVVRFTDSTYDEIKKAGTAGGSCDPGPLRESQNAMRHDHHLKYNLEARILQDVLGSDAGGLFVAFIPGKKYDHKEILAIDPHGAPALLRFTYPSPAPGLPTSESTLGVAPEEVEFLTYDEQKLGVWTAFHLASEYEAGSSKGDEQNNVCQITHHQLDTTIDKNGHLTGKATTTFASLVDGLRVIPLSLFRTLRVHSVIDGQQQPLSFIQEDKNDDADFWVVLPRPLALGEKYEVTTTYDGKDVVLNMGNGNYYPIERETWYPNQSGGFGHYASYDMTFRVPKGMKTAATGVLVSENDTGGQDVSVWKSAVPQAVAGFNLGRFKIEQAKLTSPEYVVEAYANEEPPDDIKALLDRVGGSAAGEETVDRRIQSNVNLGNMSTLSTLKRALAEAEVSVQLYSDYFGPAPYKQLAVTQQWACNYGQSWPGLVYLPICYFYDPTVRHQLGLDFRDFGYWRVVAPHEVAHQWWGHTVGFQSYRDQWMSEGFADMSASLYIQLGEKNPQKYLQFWNDERTLLLERNNMGFRAIDAGPLTMGYRMDNQRTGELARRLIYPKGAYILHMLRMMMWSNDTGDQQFKDMMRDFVKTYSGSAATTEDFKAIVEKHMTPDMRRIGDGKMDWFFDEYVYGTELPSYRVDYSFEKNAQGDVVLNLKLTQSDVSNKFRMLVPVYLELANGHIYTPGRMSLIGNSSQEAKIPFTGLKDTPRRVMVNYYYDVLAAN